MPPKPNKPPTEWQKKLRTLIDHFGSEQKTAVALGISQRTVNNYVHGVHPPRADTGKLIEELCAGISPIPAPAKPKPYPSGPLLKDAKGVAEGPSRGYRAEGVRVEVGIKRPEDMDTAELIKEVMELRIKLSQMQARVDSAQEILAGC